MYNNHTPRSSVHFGNNSRAMTMAERRGSRIRKESISRGREGSLVRGIKPKLGSGIFNHSMLMSPNTFMPEKSEEDGKSLLSGSAVADPA